MDKDVFRSGILFFFGPKHRLELHWSQNPPQPYQLENIKLFSYRIPIIGPYFVKKILSLINGYGTYIGQKSLQVELQELLIWIEEKKVPITLQEKFKLVYEYLSHWENGNIDHAIDTLCVLERVKTAKASNLLIHSFDKNLSLSEQEFDHFLEAVNAVRPGTEIEVFGSTFHCRIPN